MPWPLVPTVEAWGTLVLGEHRGHRLGLAMKARGLQELQRRIGPERTRVLTCNAEQNAHMVAINERLGFRPVEVVPTFLLRVPSPRHTVNACLLPSQSPPPSPTTTPAR